MKQMIETLELNKILEELKHDTACSLGKDRIDAMSYFTSLEDLTIELAKTDEALRLVNAYGPVSLGGLHDLSHSVRKAEMDGMLLPAELLDVASQTDVTMAVLAYQQEKTLETKYFDELCQGLVKLTGLKQKIEQCIGLDAEIYDHASSDLAKIRRSIRQTEGHIRQKMNQYLVSEKDYLSENIITSRDDRFVIPVKIGYQNKIKGIVHAQSASRQTAYIEPEAVVILNNQLQGLKAQEEEEIERILYELSQAVKKESFHLLDNQDILGELDFLFAKGCYAQRHDCVVAHVSEDFDTFYIKNARHPLIDAQHVVANTISLTKPQHILLITGSNTGGKTVNLKTAGLLSLMSLYGLAIPAAQANIPFFDDIYVDLGDEQSIEQSLSTFSSHMSKLVEITNEVTHRSLVLIDEVGSGTDPLEGQSIAQAVLEYLHDYQCFCIATTHYSSLKRHAKTSDYILLASVAFDEEKFAPTYHLVLGESGRSYALEISTRLGLNTALIERAKEIKDANQSENEKLLERLETEMEKTRAIQFDYQEKLAEVERLEEKWKHRQEVFERERQRYLDQAQDAANELVEKTKAEVDQLLREFRQKGAEVKMHEVIETWHQLESLKKDKEVPVVKGDKNYPYAVGDTVKVLSMNRDAEVLEVRKDELTISLGGIKMQVKKDDIAYVGKKKKPKVVKTKGQTVKKTGAYEINIIGMRYEEAMRTVDKFIDDAIVTGYPSVRIVHGMGTGALRNGVQQLLKKHKQIVSYRSGGPQEGGLGVTLAYFQ